MNRKAAIGLFEVGFMMVVVLSLTIMSVALLNKINKVHVIGKKQAALIEAYKEGEKTLLYIDEATSLAAKQTIYDLAKLAGFNLPKECGAYLGVPKWHAPRWENGKFKGMQYCEPETEELENDFIKMFNLAFAEYAAEFSSKNLHVKVPLDNHDIVLMPIENKNSMDIIGISKKPILISILKDAIGADTAGLLRKTTINVDSVDYDVVVLAGETHEDVVKTISLDLVKCYKDSKTDPNACKNKRYIVRNEVTKNDIEEFLSDEENLIKNSIDKQTAKELIGNKYFVFPTTQITDDKIETNYIYDFKVERGRVTVSRSKQLPLVWPTDYNVVTSCYGNRKISGRASKFHRGVDIRAGAGDNIYAIADGSVTYVGWKGGYGNTVQIDHGNFVSLYGHNKEIKVRKNQKVKAGEVIALADKTGVSKGDHLHLSIYVDGEAKDPLEFYMQHLGSLDVLGLRFVKRSNCVYYLEKNKYAYADYIEANQVG
ncbi:hypothetical protein DRJ17_00095 [Candidatus Woesearchaeota archaeon]|nr:MAG: hypothetical protein DRJ17_00095 [Candidatus Woesearchaeota archaeon]